MDTGETAENGEVQKISRRKKKYGYFYQFGLREELRGGQNDMLTADLKELLLVQSGN